jgi:hypothetical protein
MEPVPQSEFDTLIAYTPKFTPKPGEAVTLVSSPDPDDTELVGAAGRFAGLKAFGAVFFVPSVDGRSDHRFIVNRDAVFAPAPAQAEPFNGHVSDELAEAVARTVEPPAVASGVAAGEVSDDNLGRAVRQEWVAFARTLEAPKAHWLEPYEALSDDMKEVDRRIGRALFNAGQVSRNGEVAELKRQFEDLKTSRYREVGLLRQAVEAKDRELEEKHRKLVSRREENDALRQDLEAEKAAHGRTKELYASALDCLKKAKEYASPPASPDNAAGACTCRSAKGPLCDFCQGQRDNDNTPPEPLPEVLLKGSRYTRTTCGDLKLNPAAMAYTDPDGSRVDVSEVDWAHWRSQQNQDSRPAAVPRSVDGSANAVAPGVENTGHLSTDRARLEAEGWCFEEVSNSREIGQEHELLLDDSRIVRLPCGPNQWWGFQERTWVSGGGHVLAWRRAKPVATSPDANRWHCPDCGTGVAADEDGCCATCGRDCTPVAVAVESPDAGIEAVKAEVAELKKTAADAFAVERGFAIATERARKIEVRLDKLELQGRVTRRFVELLSGYVPRGPHMGLELARIEREEREAAGKAGRL